jgi:hypothetical protein
MASFNDDNSQEMIYCKRHRDFYEFPYYLDCPLCMKERKALRKEENKKREKSNALHNALLDILHLTNQGFHYDREKENDD